MSGQDTTDSGIKSVVSPAAIEQGGRGHRGGRVLTQLNLKLGLIKPSKK